MLRREPGLIEAHNAQGELANERAMERFSQHPQLNGNGKVRRQRQKEHEMAHNPEMSGGSAPRSMSRLIGHGKRKPRKAKKADSSSESDEEMSGGKSQRYSSAGMSDRMASPFHSEGMPMDRPTFTMGMPGGVGGGHPAYHQGKMLAKFIRSKHGDGHARAMMEGMLHGNGFFGDMFNKIKNEFVNPESDLRRKILPTATKVASVVAPFVPGVGTAVALGLNGLNTANSVATKLQGHGTRHTPAGRIAEKQMRAEMGNVYNNPTMPGRGRPRKGMGQPNGVSEALGTPSNGADPSGAVDVGRVANPGLGFARNTVGMGRTHPTSHPRGRVPASSAGVYFEGGALSGGYGGINHQNPTGTLNFGTGKKTRAKAGANDARKKRGAEVSRLMREKGMTLGQASKHIKEHGY